jgi:formylglycine-generating enzyme
MRALLATPIAAILAAQAGGCTYILGIENDYVVGDREDPLGTGGATASSSSQGPGGAGGTGGMGGGSPCPGGLGPAMARLDSSCVDVTEVTNAHYAAWLGASPDPGAQLAFCQWNTDFAPAADWPAPPSRQDQPVVNVDWCDAFAFCTAAGKRLCGRIGGGPVDFDGAWADAKSSQWMAACSNGGATDYPYGNGYDPAACNGKDYAHPGQLVAAGSIASCRGASAPYAAVFDLSGNAAEWEDSCDATSGAGDACRRRGGSFGDKSAAALACGADSAARSSWGPTIGFRCCAD